MLSADDAAVTTHTQQELQALMDRFSQACKDFGLTFSLKKTIVFGKITMELTAITIDDYELDVVEHFTYLGSTITDNLSLDTKIDKRIRKAATTLARLTSRVWTNPKLTVKTKVVVYNACIVGLNSFCLRSIRRILDITWQDSVQHRGPVPSQPYKHVHPPQTAQAALAGSCLLHSGWRHPKRHSLWRVSIWKEIQRPPTAGLQGCLQERHEST